MGRSKGRADRRTTSVRRTMLAKLNSALPQLCGGVAAAGKIAGCLEGSHSGGGRSHNGL
jgi:hypothetical protein